MSTNDSDFVIPLTHTKYILDVKMQDNKDSFTINLQRFKMGRSRIDELQSKLQSIDGYEDKITVSLENTGKLKRVKIESKKQIKIKWSESTSKDLFGFEKDIEITLPTTLAPRWHEYHKIGEHPPLPDSTFINESNNSLVVIDDSNKKHILQLDVEDKYLSKENKYWSEKYINIIRRVRDQPGECIEVEPFIRKGNTDIVDLLEGSNPGFDKSIKHFFGWMKGDKTYPCEKYNRLYKYFHSFTLNIKEEIKEYIKEQLEELDHIKKLEQGKSPSYTVKIEERKWHQTADVPDPEDFAGVVEPMLSGREANEQFWAAISAESGVPLQKGGSRWDWVRKRPRFPKSSVGLPTGSKGNSARTVSPSANPVHKSKIVRASKEAKKSDDAMPILIEVIKMYRSLFSEDIKKIYDLIEKMEDWIAYADITLPPLRYICTPDKGINENICGGWSNLEKPNIQCGDKPPEPELAESVPPPEPAAPPAPAPAAPEEICTGWLEETPGIPLLRAP
ncbi:MAG: hypothetical protein CL779_00125 [Chloroflexi bacterium]|nr:hypothetical protein [Chloroflexota bacterium]